MYCFNMFYFLAGLVTATVASEINRSAQPALLYLVPFTLLPLITMAYIKVTNSFTNNYRHYACLIGSMGTRFLSLPKSFNYRLWAIIGIRQFARNLLIHPTEQLVNYFAFCFKLCKL